MFINIIIVVHIIIINKVLDWYQQVMLRKGKGKGKDDYEQVLIIILLTYIIIIILNKCSINNISYDANY